MLHNASWIICLTIYSALLITFPVTRLFLKGAYFLGLLIIAVFSIFLAQLSLWDDVLMVNYCISLSFENFLGSSSVIPFGLHIQLSSLSYMFSLLVLCIAFATNIYLLNYFKGEASELKFAVWLNIFVLSMLILVLANNFFTLFIGWEGIGLSSFFLINFWNGRRATVKASFKAFTFNTVSDLCLLYSISVFYSAFNTDNLDTITYLVQVQSVNGPNFLWASVALMLCAAAKSVQAGFHLWLPDSMEAPVPASALIHSATLVSAGIFLILKFNIIFMCAGLEKIIFYWGGVTAFIGGLTACNQTDLKKLLAYSTMSHCGFLWGLAALGDFPGCILYLFLHGLFKAGTFFAAGSLIHLFGSQDMRWMRNLHNAKAEIALLVFMSINLCGLPFTVGYLYKSAILTFLGNGAVSTISLATYCGGILTSIIYFFRLNVFWLTGFNRSVKHDSTVSASLNKARATGGFTQYNVIIAIFIIFISSLVFVLLWDTAVWFFLLGNVPQTDHEALEFVTTSYLLWAIFYWYFLCIFILCAVLNLVRNTYTAAHEMFVLIFIGFLIACGWQFLCICELT